MKSAFTDRDDPRGPTWRRLAGRLALAVASALLAALVVEGAWSVWGGWSLLRRGLGLEAPEFRLPWDEERFAAAVSNPEPYRVHPDPRVGYALRANAELTILRATVTTDALGLRRRPGSPVPGPQSRIVVLGDSVAFGAGLTDEEAFGARLESLLNEARGPEVPPVVVRTVAVPGWNYRNSIAFLHDHYDELRPDLALFWPNRNDLADTETAMETGGRRRAPDPASPYPWIAVNLSDTYASVFFLRQRARTGGARIPTLAELGVEALLADLTPESSRRYDDVAEWVGRLGAQLAAHGARLVLLHYLDEQFMTTLRQRLALGDRRVEVVHLLGRTVADDTLGWNPHPNRDTARHLAVWVARDLLDRGLISAGQAGPLPEVPRDFADRRSPARESREYVRLAAEYRASAERALRDVIDADTGEGIVQVLGGLSPEGLVGPGMLAVLPAGCGVLEISTELPPERPDLAPITVAVRAGGEPLGELEVVDGGSTRGFAIPETIDDRPFELELAALDWGVVRSFQRSLAAAFRLHSVRCNG